ncbi:hypothetical protein HDU79_003640 [Rhizoclosmatium sp. JEL0117]|nr:hypothetical protein HDU79_003640 [Rhizoclosmatium sp. JEL0117]
MFRLTTHPILRISHRSSIALRSYSASGAGGFKEQPGPIPLADRAQQQEFEKLVKKFNESSERHPDAPKMDTIVPEFEGPVNPKTGEVNGPKGPEPTRYGDWESKGRVYDF